MQTDRLVRYAARQTVIVVAATVVVPVTGIVLLILLNTLQGLFCEQLISLMILTALATTITLGVKQARQSKS